MEKQNHLNDEILLAFHQEKLSQEEYMQVLEHITKCDSCAELFADSFTNANTLSMPHYLKNDIMNQIYHREEAKSIINRQLFTYSLKVCAAMAGAIFLTFSGLFHSNFSSVPVEFPLFNMSKISDFNKSLNEFSTKIINSEVGYYDQEKK